MATEVIINSHRRFGTFGYLKSQLAPSHVTRSMTRSLVQSTSAGPVKILVEGSGLRYLGAGLPIDGSQDCARDFMKAGALGVTITASAPKSLGLEEQARKIIEAAVRRKLNALLPEHRFADRVVKAIADACSEKPAFISISTKGLALAPAETVIPGSEKDALALQSAGKFETFRVATRTYEEVLRELAVKWQIAMITTGSISGMKKAGFTVKIESPKTEPPPMGRGNDWPVMENM
jgi:hypothetical protein